MLPRSVHLVVFLAISIPGVPATSVAQEGALPEVRIPKNDEGLNSLEARKRSNSIRLANLRFFTSSILRMS